ncbi:Malonate utilization transcriptional regulator [Pseudomonas coronafaciens pv. striafaciens]|nr:hypothetical protein HBB04_03199 [Pseudomonas coronafaciens]RMM77618.1 Malonate utilization transcriptional regulator [Pseudomonas coronafaciens pv. striafaciens]
MKQTATPMSVRDILSSYRGMSWAQSAHTNNKRHDMQIDDELTLKKLEIFLAFMRTGNLARAAEALQTSNVSVHRAIHSLESALRCPLFKHEGRNLTPLESAYVLEERAQKLVQDVLATVELTRQAAGFSAARFRLGALYSLTVKSVPFTEVTT